MIQVLLVLFLFVLQAAALAALVWVSWSYFDRRYKAKQNGERATLPDPGYEPTAEVFIDPKDRRRYRVYYNPRSGDRQYVEEPQRQ